MSAENQIKTTIEELLKVLATKNVIGEPIEIEDKTLIPITKIGVGFGAGGGKGEKGESGGAGGGAGVDAVAMVVIFKGVPGPEGIKVLPLAAPSPLAKSIGEIASVIMEKLRERKEAKKEEK
ncbi:MAG: sporulation protein [archaeon]|nr:sporulation protein [archaeon]MCP8316971.1 sporulation protein [archaeon]